MKTRDWIIGGMAIAILILLGGNYCQYQKKSELENNVLALEDVLEVKRNKDSTQTAQIASLESTSKAAFMALRSKDATIVSLKEEVRKYKGKVQAAAIVKMKTRVAGSVALKDSTPYLIDNKWETGKVWRVGDRFNWDITPRNEMTLVIGKPLKWNPFRKQPLQITVTQKNKNTSTTEVRSVMFKQGQQRFGLGFYAGYGILVGWDGKVYHGFNGGFGVTYRFFP